MPRIDAGNAARHQDGFIGEFYIRPMSLPPRQESQGESHHADHVTVILEGEVDIHWRDPGTGDEGVIEVRAPCKINIQAERHHRFVALDKPVRWECWFAKGSDAFG